MKKGEFKDKESWLRYVRALNLVRMISAIDVIQERKRDLVADHKRELLYDKSIIEFEVYAERAYDEAISLIRKNPGKDVIYLLEELLLRYNEEACSDWMFSVMEDAIKSMVDIFL